ncbi:hypothetical protein Tco_1303418 [Tanacetum coccineum]
MAPLPGREEQASKVSSQYWKPPIFYDDEESTIPLNEIDSQIPSSIAITPDEFIKSSVEDFVPIPSESGDTSESDSECDLPSDDESLSDEDVPEDNVKIYSNPLFKFDNEYISSDVNPLFDEVLENIESKDSYVSNLDEPALLVIPLSDANKDECFDPGGDIDEIDVFLDVDISTDIEDSYHDSEGDIIYLESLLSDLPLKVFLDHDPKSLRDINDSKIMVKVFDPGIHDKKISPTGVGGGGGYGGQGASRDPGDGGRSCPDVALAWCAGFRDYSRGGDVVVAILKGGECCGITCNLQGVRGGVKRGGSGKVGLGGMGGGWCGGGGGGKGMEGHGG